MKLSLAYITLLAASVTGWSDTLDTTPTLDMIAEQNAYETWQGANQSASLGTYVYADLNFVYTRASAEGFSYGQLIDVTISITDTVLIDANADIRRPQYQWEPGLKVGLGVMIPPRQEWDLSLYWNYLHSKASDSVPALSGPTQMFRPSWLPTLLGSTAEHASADWSMNLNTLDLALSRSCFLGRWLSVEPTIGLRAAWLFQNYHVKYLGNFVYIDTNTFESTALHANTSLVAKNNYSALGMRFGSDFEFHVTRSFSFVGNGMLSLLYGRFDINQIFDGVLLQNIGNPTPSLLSEVISFPNAIHAVRPCLETELGAQWHAFFNSDKSCVTIGVFYDLAYWFTQNRMTNPILNRDAGFLQGDYFASDYYLSPQDMCGDLYLTGWRFQLRLDY